MSPTPVGLPCQRWGNGSRRVLLVHGLGGCAATWWRVAEALASQDCTVLAPTLRGHGEAPLTSDYRMSAYCADLAELGDDWACVVGQSLGGVLALQLAGRPGATRSLVLLDPVLVVPDDMFEVVTRAQLRALDRPTDPAEVQRLNPTWPAGDVLAAARSATGTSSWVVTETMSQNRPWHHVQALSELTIPTHIIGADPNRGAVCSKGLVEPYLTDTVRFVCADGSSHAVYRDAADLVIATVLGLLDQA